MVDIDVAAIFEEIMMDFDKSMAIRAQADEDQALYGTLSIEDLKKIYTI